MNKRFTGLGEKGKLQLETAQEGIPIEDLPFYMTDVRAGPRRTVWPPRGAASGFDVGLSLATCGIRSMQRILLSICPSVFKDANRFALLVSVGWPGSFLTGRSTDKGSAPSAASTSASTGSHMGCHTYFSICVNLYKLNGDPEIDGIYVNFDRKFMGKQCLPKILAIPSIPELIPYPSN